MKKLILFAIAVALTACAKNQQVKVTYLATSSISAYSLHYTRADGTLEETLVTPQSVQDNWAYSFIGEEGDIVYLSGKYSDIQSGLQLLILLDGKIYKQVSGEGDTLKYMTVSGVVPYQ